MNNFNQVIIKATAQYISTQWNLSSYRLQEESKEHQGNSES